MQYSSFEKQLYELVLPPIKEAELELWGLEILSGSKQTIRLFIDSPNGITADNCARMSKKIDLILEVETIMHGAYILELSSPGFNRRFFNAEQSFDYIDREVEIKLYEPLDQRKNFFGKLIKSDKSSLELETEAETFSLLWENVKKANVYHSFESTSPKIIKK